jgi:hypothetical protein
LLCVLAATAPAEPAPGSAARPANPAGASVEGRMLPAWLAGLRGSLSIEAESFESDSLILQDVRLPFAFREDGLVLAEGTITSQRGKVTVDGRYRCSDNDLSLRISGDNLLFDTKPPITARDLVFDNEDILPGWLHDVDGRIQLDLNLVVIDEVALRTFTGQIVFTDTGFEADVAALIGEGSLKLDVDHVYSTARTALNLSGSDVGLGAMRVTRDYFEDAPTTFDLQLTGEGTSERAFVSSMNGIIELEVGEGRIKNTEINRLAKNIFALTFDSISPFAKKSQIANLECAAARLEFVNGRAETAHGLVFRSDKLIVVGQGVLDMNAETLDLQFRPHVRQGIKTKTGGAFSLVSLYGRLDKPEVTIKARGLVKEGLSLGAAWMTFGLSKAAEALFDWGTRADIACEYAVAN